MPDPQPFFARPILNGPYDHPRRHWELHPPGHPQAGQPTQQVVDARRAADFITPIPKPRKRKGKKKQTQEELTFDQATEVSDDDQGYKRSAELINAIRQRVDKWRDLANPADWRVTPETQRLLQHWRHHDFSSYRPFFCQQEAVEVAIWLTEVAPEVARSGGVEGRGVAKLLQDIEDANEAANPGLPRIALKLATGAGKTTVMAMLIAWQTVNAARRPQSTRYSRGFLIVAPGITIKDRLRVLLPGDPDSYYTTRELVPTEYLPELRRASIVITNYHAFKLRETMELSRGNRALLQGQTGDAIQSLETEGQMIQRVMAPLMGLKKIVVLNDEAHHCYREKPGEDEADLDAGLDSDQKADARTDREAARLWISGLEAVHRLMGLGRVYDLSATPFFLSGSGYREGTLFPWTVSDFSLMDAIECGIVKLPRVPIADNVPQSFRDDVGGDDTQMMPMLRELWKHIGKKMPKGNRKTTKADPDSIPPLLQTALTVLYGHYEKTYDHWVREKKRSVPPCFIVVCNNTATSKLVFDYISGFYRQDHDGRDQLMNGRLPLFRNFDEYDQPLDKPNTILVDSAQLESGEGIDNTFRDAARTEIQAFQRAQAQRHGAAAGAAPPSDAELLREVMNTVGQAGGLGQHVRCVVSVSMLTEGWDANNVTHVLGVRAFGTQLLCEQVMGRALRRQSYQLNEEGLFNPEYADVLGIPFDFTAKPAVAPVHSAPETTTVRAVRPERDPLEIRFPRVTGYRVDFPKEVLDADFTDDSKLEISPALIGPGKTINQGIVGQAAELDLTFTKDARPSTLVLHLAKHLLQNHYRDEQGRPQMHLIGPLKKIARRWIDECLTCTGGAYPAQLQYRQIADRAAEKIAAAINRRPAGESPVIALPDPFNPVGSTAHVRFNTTKTDLWDTAGIGLEGEAHQTGGPRNHVSHVVLDSSWEAEFCRVAETHPRVLKYTKNHALGLSVPYRLAGESKQYVPDFVVVIDDGHGPDNPLHLMIEVKGYRGQDAAAKRDHAVTYWVPGVNHLHAHGLTGACGRWAFHEFGDVFAMEDELEARIAAAFSDMFSTFKVTPDSVRDVR